eukprot:212369_1
MQNFMLVSAYIVTIFVSVVAIILLFMIIHLIGKCKKQCKTKDHTLNTKSVLFFITATMIACLSFQICVFLTITIMCIIMVTESNPFHYHTIFQQMPLLIPLFDSFGHLMVLTVFIARYEVCFANSIFGDFTRIISIMHICLIILILMSITTLALHVFLSGRIQIVIISEIIWELLIEILFLWILYQFIRRLLTLLKWSLKCVNPQSSNLELFKGFRASLGPNLIYRRSHESNTDIKQSNVHSKPELHLSISMQPPSDQSVSVFSDTTANKQDMDILNVMAKMTSLIIICVLASIFSIYGNLFIELHGINNLHNNVNTIWTFLLPIIDIIITSFTLYLQFNFVESIYVKLCGVLDTRCLKIGLRFVKFCLKKEELKNVKNTSNIITLATETTKTDMKIDNDIEIIFDDAVSNEYNNDINDLGVETPITPLMANKIITNSESVYKLPAIQESDKNISVFQTDKKKY